MLFECWNSVKLSKNILVPFTKNFILLTNLGIYQKTFGVKPHRLDPSLTTVVLAFLKCMNGSVLVFLKCMDGFVLVHFRFPMQFAPTRFPQLGNSEVP